MKSACSANPWAGSGPTIGTGRAQLKIVTWANEEVASDALSIHGYERYTAADYALSAWYPPRRGARPPDQAQPAGPSGRPAGVTKWWADGDEPLYYIVSSKARGVPSSLGCAARGCNRAWFLCASSRTVHGALLNDAPFGIPCPFYIVLRQRNLSLGMRETCIIVWDTERNIACYSWPHRVSAVRLSGRGGGPAAGRRRQGGVAAGPRAL